MTSETHTMHNKILAVCSYLPLFQQTFLVYNFSLFKFTIVEQKGGIISCFYVNKTKKGDASGTGKTSNI